MRYAITGRNMEVTDDLKEVIYEKIGKLEKYFHQDTEAQITLSEEKGGRKKIEVTIPVKHGMIRSEQVSNSMLVSIDLAEEVIERQMKKYRTKIIDRYQDASALSQAFIEEETDDTEESIRIVRSKRFAVKPMDPEEACFQMEMLG